MSYCDQFFRSEPTRLGRWLAEVSLRSAFQRLLKNGQVNSVIEVGPGRGVIAQACRKRNIDYLGIDCNPGACDSLEKQGFKMKQAFVPPFPEDIEPADAFIATMVIEHMPTCKEAEQFVHGARDLLNDDGLILLVAPDIRYARSWFWHAGYSHNFVTSAYRLAQILDENGFDVLYANVRTMCVPYPWCNFIYYPSRLIPCQLLEMIFGKHPRFGRSIQRKSIWFKTKMSLTPHALVIARKT